MEGIGSRLPDMSPHVKYDGHDRPLLLVEETNYWLNCDACGYEIKDSFYLRCIENSSIRFHVQCGSPPSHPLPETIVDKKHMHYSPLRLTSNDDTEGIDSANILGCGACNEERNPLHPFYRCGDCDYSVHVRCVITEKHFDREKLKHPGHWHWLHLRDDCGATICDFCEKSVDRQCPAYACATCKFTLHKSCGEVRREVQHPLHPSCSLTLSHTLPNFIRCEGCGSGIKSYYYECRKHKFYLHPNCLYITPSVSYEGHREHKLTLVEDEIVFEIQCKACGFGIEGNFRLRCVECHINFHVHECWPRPSRQLPPTVIVDDTTLALITPPPDLQDDENDVILCNACNKERNPRHPFYRSAEGDYSAHVHCAITGKHFDRESVLKHPGHRHYLHFSEKYDDDDDGDIRLCDLCGERVHQGCPAYSCAACKFSLHNSCVQKNPLQIWNHLHSSHPLYLAIPIPQFMHTRRCNACLGELDAYCYHCLECSAPGFDLHIECTSLQPWLKYEGHPEHTLIYFDKLGGSAQCKKCYRSTASNPDASFLRCPDCNFTIHFYCTPLPKFISHRSHHHPLKLMDDLVDFNHDDQVCDVCETNRNPKECAYYCPECSYVAEFECVLDEVLPFLEKEPQDKEMMRIVNEGDPDAPTLADVYDSLTEEEIQDLDHIKDSLNNAMEEIWKQRQPEEADQEDIVISEKYPYTDEAMTKFLCWLFNALQVESVGNCAGFYGLDSKMVDVKLWGYSITRNLVPVMKELTEKYGDIDYGLNGRHLSDNCKSLFVTKLCQVVQEMRGEKVKDVEADTILNWWTQAKHVQCAGFKVDFLFDQLKRIVCAKYGAETEAYRNDKLYDLRKKIDDLSKKIEKLNADKEKLLKETRDLISNHRRRPGSDGQFWTFVPSRVEDEVMSDLVLFMMENAARGLL